jgi:hypothetical protein
MRLHALRTDAHQASWAEVSVVIRRNEELKEAPPHRIASKEFRVPLSPPANHRVAQTRLDLPSHGYGGRGMQIAFDHLVKSV